MDECQVTFKVLDGEPVPFKSKLFRSGVDAARDAANFSFKV